MICSFPDCGRRAVAFGLCGNHRRQQRCGLPLMPAGYYYRESRPFYAGGVPAERPPRASGRLPCSFPGCPNKQASRGLCDAHKLQQRKGQALRPVKKTGEPIALVVRSLVERPRNDGCWKDWPFSTDSAGRPKLAFRGRLVRVAALIVRFEHGVWAEHACHTCDEMPCWNPDHLYPGTAASNHADMIARGRARWQKAS